MESLAEECRFRDCTHQGEPGCAVCAAVAAGVLPRTRYDSYQALCREAADVRDRREQARRLNKDKAAYSKHYRKKGAGPSRGGRRR